MLKVRRRNQGLEGEILRESSHANVRDFSVLFVRFDSVMFWCFLWIGCFFSTFQRGKLVNSSPNYHTFAETSLKISWLKIFRIINDTVSNP